MIAKVCDPSANKNMTGIEKIHQAGQYVSDHLSAIADDIERGLISCPASRIDILRANEPTFGLSDLTQGGADSISSSIYCLRRNRWPGSHGFQTAFVSARAQRTFLVHTDMTDIPRGAITAAVDLPIGNDACTNPGSYFYKK